MSEHVFHVYVAGKRMAGGVFKVAAFDTMRGTATVTIHPVVRLKLAHGGPPMVVLDAFSREMSTHYFQLVGTLEGVWVDGKSIEMKGIS